MKKLAFTLAIVIMFSLLAACNGGSEQNSTAAVTTGAAGQTTASGTSGGGGGTESASGGEADKYGGTLSMVLTADPVNVNFTVESGPSTQYLRAACFDTLLAVNADGGYEPRMAESWEASTDGLVWTFHLREGLTWHDDTPFTAQDIVFSYNYLMQPDLEMVNPYPTIGTAAYVDDLTFTLTLEAADSSILYNVYRNARFVPKHIWENVPPSQFLSSPAAQTPMGLGPFKFSEYVPGEFISFDRFDGYWQGKPYLDKIVMRIIPDTNAQQTALESGQVHYIPLSTAEYMVISGGNADIKFEVYPTNIYCWLVLNHTNPSLDDVNVRRAVAHLVNKDAIINQVYGGIGSEAVSCFSVNDMYYSADACVLYDFNIDTANQILDEAGWEISADGVREKDGKRLEFECVYRSGGATYLSKFMIMMADFHKAGIKLNVKAVDSSIVTAALTESPELFDIMFLRSGMGPDPSGWSTTLGGDTFFYLQDDALKQQINDLFSAARLATSEAERAKLYGQIQTLYTDNALSIPVYNRTQVSALAASLMMDEALMDGGFNMLNNYWLLYFSK